MDWILQKPKFILIGVAFVFLAIYLLWSEISLKRKYTRLPACYLGRDGTEKAYAKLRTRGFDCKLRSNLAAPSFPGSDVREPQRILLVRNEQFREAERIIETDNQPTE